MAALYSDRMTSVYSGGLVYEYSQEESDYGLVEIGSDSVKELPDFQALKAAFDETPAPSGDGGYRGSGEPSECPAQSSTWNVSSNALPSIPAPAVAFMEDGAGEGPGLDGPGSQNAGTASSGTAEAGSGQVSSTARPDGAAAGLVRPGLTGAPFVGSCVLLAMTLLGATAVL